MAAAWLLLAAVLSAHAQTPQFPQTIAPNTLLGRLGNGVAGPVQAIPFATFQAQIFGALEPANQVYAGPASNSAGNQAPAFRALVGADLPNPSASTLGGVESLASVASKWINTISTSGVPSATQPAFTDISGNLALATQVSGTLAGANYAAANPGTTGNGGLTVATAHINLLRNSSLTAWFHGCFTAGSCSITTAGGWCAEGIYVVPTGATVTCQETTTCPANSPSFYCVKITGAASVTDVKVRFVQESYSSIKVAGLASTFQFQWINNSGSSITPTLATKYPTAQDNWASSTADLSATNLQACANAATCTEAYTLSVNAGANNGYEEVVDFGNNFGSGSNTLTIGGGFDFRATVGITTGLNSTPPAPEIVYPSIDLQWCERFYQTSYDNGTAPGAATHLGMAGGMSALSASTNPANPVNFRTTMRADPGTINYYDGAGNASKVSTVGNGATTFTDNVAAVNAPFNISQHGFLFTGPASTTTSYVHYTADATITGG